MSEKNKRIIKAEILDEIAFVWEKNPNVCFSSLFHYEKDIPDNVLLLLLRNKRVGCEYETERKSI